MVAGSLDEGHDLAQLHYPLGLAVNDDQTIFIADSCNHRIMAWREGATQGEVMAGGNGRGDRLDQLNGPTDVIVDRRTDSILVCDRGNERIVRWLQRQSGTIYRKQGAIIIDNVDCSGLTMDNRRDLYVSNWLTNEVRRYRLGETEGTLVAGGHGKGHNLHQLNGPTGLFVDQDYSVYVSDWGNHRVMKWTKGASKGTIVAGGQGQGKSLTQLSYPQGIQIDSTGAVYVVDTWNNRIIRFNPGEKEGIVVVGGGETGKGTDHLNRPVGLAFDRHGHLYVTDQGNSRVQRFFIDKN